MAHIASEMERQGFTVPLLIGGATTSKIHTAVKLDPAYKHGVIHVKDASKCVPVVSNLLSNNNRETYIQQLHDEYSQLRESYKNTKSKVVYLPLSQARVNKLKIDWTKESIAKPSFTGIKVFEDFPLSEIREYISWVFFFIVWQIKGKYPELLNDPIKGEEARKLFNDANKMLDELEKSKRIKAKGVFGIFPANSVGDDIEVYTDENRNKILTVFRNLRNQEQKENGEPNLCLSDFIAPKECGVADYIGAFAVTAGIGVDDLIKEYKKNLDDYSLIMLEALADRLAEAFTELIHEKIRKEYWGYAAGEKLSIDEMIMEKYKGIRPAHGYPACPDHTEKKTLFSLLNATENAGITLTESCSMVPGASVSGLIFANPKSKYFFVDKISKEQVLDYALRKGATPEQVESWLAHNLNY
jgi:5-methyltetrahydrofolate--homocysteine methyltransferase